MTLIALYAGCLVLGGILIGASMLGAGKDADGPDMEHDVGHDADLEHDHAHDHDVHAVDSAHGAGGGAIAATLLSLRFWTFGLAAFGMTGLLLTLLGATPVLGVALSVATGIGVGSGVTTLLRAVSRDTVSSALDARALRGRDAEIVLSVGPGKLGKIRLTHNGQLIELPATTREDRLLERAQRVLVVDVAGGTAEVTSLEPDRRTPASLSTPS